MERWKILQLVMRVRLQVWYKQGDTNTRYAVQTKYNATEVSSKKSYRYKAKDTTDKSYQERYYYYKENNNMEQFTTNNTTSYKRGNLQLCLKLTAKWTIPSPRPCNESVVQLSVRNVLRASLPNPPEPSQHHQGIFVSSSGSSKTRYFISDYLVSKKSLINFW